MKKIMSVLLVLALAMSLTVCVSAEDQDLLAKAREKGEIVVAMEGAWRPWTYHDENDVLVGFDTEVSQKIAEKLGISVKFEETDFTGCFAGMESGRFDLVVNGVDYTEECAAKYDFSAPYAYARTALVVKGDNETIKGFEDLKGVKTANSIGSTYMELAESYGAIVDGVDTLDQTISLVISGRAQATLNSELSILDYLTEHPDADIKVIAYTDDPYLICIPMRKGAETETLRAEIDKAIEEMHADGTLTELALK